MNESITRNLFEFWTYIGRQNNLYREFPHYKAVTVVGSDWPKRVYDVTDKREVYDEVIRLASQNLLPNMMTLDKKTGLPDRDNTQLILTQTNMALPRKNYPRENPEDASIYPVKTKSEALEFARVASLSFGYRVDGEIVFNLCQDSSRTKLFVLKDQDGVAGCGIIFFDQDNIAGFHMIGTDPKARGKGIAKRITERLIAEARSNYAPYCVLNASKMGQALYEKLGFTEFGIIEDSVHKSV
jgi:ribosomal protein S18 acetylase RimI-like enzyme